MTRSRCIDSEMRKPPAVFAPSHVLPPQDPNISETYAILTGILTIRYLYARAKLGIKSGDGGAWLLQRVVGASTACEMTFTGDTSDAKEALACGLLSRVVPAEKLLPEARAVAARIASNPSSVRMRNKPIRETRHARLQTILEMSAAVDCSAFGRAHDGPQ